MTRKEKTMITFYIAPDPNETDPLLKAHNKEAEERGAEFWNYGAGTSESVFESKTTNKGYLVSIMRDGKVAHRWYDSRNAHTPH